MYNKKVNIATIKTVAEGLKDLRDQVVFIGGAVISLYTDDPATDEIRPTQDIDLTINIGDKYSDLAKLEERFPMLMNKLKRIIG